MRVEDETINIGGPRQRTILAMLLLSPNRAVSVDSLIEAVWPSGPPATARNQIAICVAGLRKVFNDKAGGGELITTSHPGYVLNGLEHHIDTIEFDARVGEARELARSGQTAAACGLITEALALWRGPALDGLSGDRIEAEAAQLESVRLNLREEYAELQLKLGRHHTVIPTLTTLVKEHPLREQARAHLILAHYRSGRRADALAVFREGRDLMAEELGIEPGPALQSLHNLVLKDSPTLVLPAHNPAPAPHTRAPAQLPVQSASFTGRTEALRRLDGMLDERYGQSPLIVAAISGVSGVGKTALAVRWANQVAGRFPDGQLFTDLRGYHEKDEPVTTNAVLDQFLRSLGVPATQIPADLDERAGLYRSMLGGKRMLIVLDNVRDVEQIRPLLPGSGRCCVLITSRDPMVGLLGDFALLQVPLHVMSPEEARNLLAEIAGSTRVESNPQATADLAALCDRLPLALRIAGARLAAKPYWTVRDLAMRLRDQRRRLDELSLGDLGVRAGFRLSYRDLSPSARRLYRRIGLLTVPDFAAWAAASLIDTDCTEAESLLEELLDAQLLSVSSTHSGPVVRYRCQDLLRVFAWECAQAEESEEEQGGALERLYAAYLQIADVARRRRYGGSHHQGYGAPLATPQPAHLIDLLVEDPMAWFESERTALTDLITQAAAAGRSSYAWGLTVNATTLFEAKNHLEDWHTSAMASLAAAQRTGDRRGEATMLRSLGTRAIYQRRYDEAESWLQPALDLFEQEDDPQGLAVVQRNLALCRRFVGDLPQAQDLTRRSLEAFRLAGDLAGESHALGLLAQIELENGNIDSGIALSTQAIAKSSEAGSRRGEAQNTYRLAEAKLRQGDHLGAEQACFAVLALLDSEGDRLGEGHALRGIGEARWRRGDTEEAVTVLRKAMSAAKDVNDRYLHARALTDFGCAQLLLGLPESLERLREAQAVFIELGASVWGKRSTHLVAAAERAFGSEPPDPPSPVELAQLVDS
ncbi:BTAD domain-containing putative transcriptional regulator [Streptomyces sp. NBC_00091]|uniref:AfsR/SARP family transcriptional regulator n=1 Tax=Streptomyces sp. NBC_00091 TaxID=2975648 RepID=UPI0022597FA5|nr:BTAD domain-containing putative transcriptional regulator [Streptomyces sp. NBC_00091]MCX5375315.1 tetratricopeptide repeat protein [Streptomyces sp. NBC_00091]